MLVSIYMNSINLNYIDQQGNSLLWEPIESVHLPHHHLLLLL